jgi:hypothetical protein
MVPVRARLLLLLLVPAVAAAQDPVEPARDSLADSVAVAPPADSTTTERLLAVEGRDRQRLRVIPRVGFGELQPSGSRVVLTRDSIDWAPARTLGELLAATTPTYLWRGGWLLTAEIPNVLGGGATSVEYVYDGLPVIPVGPDSLLVDPSLWSLELIDRVEVERSPGRLRVFIWSRQHDRAAPATRIGVATGDRAYARYLAGFEKRYASGIGVALEADYTNVDAPEGGSGGGHLTNGLARISWQPSPRFGVELSTRISAPARDALLRDADTPEAFPDTLATGLEGRRSDSQLRLAWRQRIDHMGWRADAWAGRTSWTSDSLEQSIGTFGTTIGFRQPTTSAEVQLLHRTEWTPLDARLALGWAPADWLSGAVEGSYQRHTGDRRSRWMTTRLGAELPLGVRVGMVMSHGERVEAPALAALEPQSFSSYEGSIGLGVGPLGVEGRLTSTDVRHPLAYRTFAAIDGFARQPRTEWLGVSARLAPNNWLSFASHYEHPQGFVVPDGVPPHHAWSTATINSRFLRNFASGIFRLQVQGVVETWSPGVIGRDPTGEAIALPGLTFVRGIVQLKIGPFMAYWDRVNFQATDGGTVPGYQIFRLGSSYGIRWQFNN